MIVQEWFSEKMQMAKVDFSTVLPRFISLYIFSFLNPKDLCAAAQVSWAWKFLTEQVDYLSLPTDRAQITADCLWMPKCIRFGWFLPYTPTDNEYGAWKHHYIACVSNLDWPIPREATAMYGTLNEPKREDEELQERQREKRLRKIIWEKIALRKKELFKVRPPWASGTCCARLLKSKCQPRLSQTVRDRVGLHEALEKQLVLASLEALPKRSNLHIILISSRIPAYERTKTIVVDSIKAGIISLVYEHCGLTLESLLYLIEKALDGRKAQSMGIFSEGDSREINLLQGYKIGIKNLLRPEVRDFWEKLGSYVAPEQEGGHVDLFVPLGASEAGIEVLSQLSQLTGTFFTAPTGIATGSYQHSESKLQMWSSLADFLEDTLKSVRKQLSPLFKELQKNISAKIIGQFMFDHMSVANILNNQEIAQALADGLMELSKDNSDKPLEFLSNFLLKRSSKESKDFGEDVILTKCDPKATFDLFMKHSNKIHTPNQLAIHKEKLMLNKVAAAEPEVKQSPSVSEQVLYNQGGPGGRAEALVRACATGSERNVREDNPQDAKSSLSKDDLNFETLVKLERKLQMDSAGKRTGVVRELLRSERKYVQMLETVREVYAAPLQAALSSNRAILSAANIRIIFSDVLRILSLNRQFLDHLRDRLQEWGPAHGVGEIFLKFGSQLNIYTNFFNNYPVVLKTMEKSLPELLLHPSRRFEEYINLLYALRLHTPAEHVDRGDLTAAIDQVKNYKRYIDQVGCWMKQNIGMRDQLSDIQRIVRGCPTLSEENRYLIRVQDVAQLHCCDEAWTYEHTRDLSLFLFNDALLVSSRGTSHTPFERTSKSTYQFIASVALHRLLVEDIPDSKYIRNAFIVQGPKREWVCATEAGDDKFLWLSALQRAIKSSLDK
ncbi:epithelial cell-transforming sequence 2 oncogene-like isoform X1 [Prionailurus iriomotensis]